MTQHFIMHPDNPQQRFLQQVVASLRDGSLMVYPTDSSYAFGCQMGAREAVNRISRLRQTGKDHNFTLICRSLSEVATYARVEDWAYRLMRAHTPGPYTFILPATREVPRRLQNPRRRTIGIRIPDHPVPLGIVEMLGEPIMSSTLILADDDIPLNDPEQIAARLQGHVDLLIESGNCSVEPTSVVDLTAGFPRVLREGRGDVSAFG